MSDALATPFEDHDRFRVVRRLGRGGFGEVWEAWDELQQTVVALKTLRELSDDALLRFKAEFRTLTDVAHPSLVTLYELACAGGTWFFTMEKVDGVSLLEWVRPGWVPADDATFDLDADAPAPREATPTGELDEVRLRAVLGQLVDAVAAMHAAGVVHRDLKPSNLLVTAAGRLVVLDFGLAAEVAAHQGTRFGTPAYMSPEQVRDLPVDGRSDWYSVGVVLFEALTGVLPFTGSLPQMLVGRLHYDPPDPRELASGLPPDLCDLALELLARDPAGRPDEAGVRELLALPPPPLRRRAPFVGRERELQALREARERGRRRTTVLLLTGPSGIGKTSLVDRLLEACDGTVLRGRCYQREQVPFKGVDQVVADLARCLGDRPTSELPRGMDALVRLFPVLRRPADAPAPLAEPRGQRRQATGALRALLRALPDPVVVVDDVQWGDPDGAEILEALLEPPDAPPMLLVLTCRTTGLDAPVAAMISRMEAQRLEVPPLDDAEATTLARALLGDTPHVAAVVREAGGNPALVDGLARHAGDGVRDTGGLQKVVLRQLDALPDEARRLLEQIAVAGAPLPRRVLRRALGVEHDQATVSRLRLAQLVQATRTDGDEWLEPFHDRIRDIVLGAVTPDERAGVHRQLADALDALGEGEPAERLRHELGAGRTDRARGLALVAARQAAEALAFYRATELFETALKLGAGGWELLAELGEVRAACGRCLEAGEALLEAASEAPEPQATELRRLAGQQLLQGGHLELGLQVLRELLREAGLRPSAGPWSALVALGTSRLRLWWRGTRLLEGPADPGALRRVDTAWSAASALSTLDTLRATDLQVRHLLLAQESGDRLRMARALALEAGWHAAAGAAGQARAQALLDRARALATTLDDPHPHAVIAIIAGISEYLGGRWTSSLRHLAEAEERLATCRHASWERGQVVTFQIECLTMLGRWDLLAERVPPLLTDARQGGNLHLERFLRYVRGGYVLLAQDRPEAALREVEEMGSPSGRAWHVSHWWGLFATVQALLYRGDADGAWARLRAAWPSIRGSLLFRVSVIAVTCRVQRGRVALARAARKTGLERRHLACLAGSDARFLERSGLPWAQGWAGELRAGQALVLGRRDEALGAIDDAAARLEASEMHLHAACAALRAAELRGDTAAAEAAREQARRLGIAAPDRLAALFCPPDRLWR